MNDHINPGLIESPLPATTDILERLAEAVLMRKQRRVCLICDAEIYDGGDHDKNCRLFHVEQQAEQLARL